MRAVFRIKKKTKKLKRVFFEKSMETISVPMVQPADGTTGLLLVSHGKGLGFRVKTQE